MTRDSTTETSTEPGGRSDLRALVPVLTVIHHPDVAHIGKRLLLAGRASFDLGRSSQHALGPCLDDGRVSRKHAEFVSDREHFRIIDCGSRNGTQVNGAAVDERLLQFGDVVGLGRVLLLLHRGPVSYTPATHPTIWGRSASIARTLESAELVAADHASVAIVGETGCGKDLIARHLHELSGRKGAFVPMNCGGMATGVLQSQLFGHLRGAFSGADVTRNGLVREAESGTLFLDEVAAAPDEMQTTLLRLLESKEYRMVGGSELMHADVRFVCAVPPGVESLMRDQQFRSDLWFRLTQRVVRVDALRDRREDIPLLAREFAQRVTNKPVAIGTDFALALVMYRWPGNVRQLRSFVERVALDQRESDKITLEPEHQRELGIDLPKQGQARARQRRERRSDPGRESLERSLEEAKGNLAAVARTLSVPRKTLYRWLEAHAIDVTKYR